MAARGRVKGKAAARPRSLLSAAIDARSPEEREEDERWSDPAYRRAARLKAYTLDELQRELEARGYRVTQVLAPNRPRALKPWQENMLLSTLFMLEDFVRRRSFPPGLAAALQRPSDDAYAEILARMCCFTGPSVRKLIRRHRNESR